MPHKYWYAMTVFGAVFLVAIIGFSVHSAASDDTKELTLLHVITRHGARTPASTYPNDPYVNETFYPVGWGQLTNEGKRMLYGSGQFLREKYGKFLGPNYTPDLYYSQATDVDRTKASLQVVNAGLWPPTEEEVWGPLPWQPIPVHSEPLNADNLLLVRKPCPQYHIEYQRVLSTEEIKKKLKENRELFQYLTEKSGQKTEDFDSVQDIYSTLLAEEGYNLTLPEWTKGYYPNKMIEPTIFSYTLNAYNNKLNRLKGGVLLKKLIEDWKSKENGSINPKDRKAFLYGGHDSTIVNILRTLNIWDTQFPGYGIMIIFEFSKDIISNTYGVEVFLRNSTEVPPFQLTIPGCDSFCPLEKLVKLTEDVIPVNWEAECATTDKEYVVPELGGP